MFQSNYKLLIDKLDEFIRKYYKNQLIKGLIYSIALLLGFFVALTTLEHYAHFDTLARTILFYVFILSNLYILIRLVAVPLVKLNNLGARISHEQAAKIIGNHFPQVKDKLLNVLQLKELSSANQNELLEASIDQKIKELKPLPFASAIDLTENRKYLKYALAPALIIGLILFAAPSMITDSTKRLIKHDTYFEKEAPFQFIITNKNLQAVQQEDFELQVKLTGEEVPEEVFLQVGDNEYKLNKENTISFNYLFKNIQNSIKFRLSAAGFKSKEYELNALPNPVLMNFDIALDYPNYVGKKDEIVKNTGDIEIPAGTKVSWKFNTENTDILRLSFNDTAFNIVPFENTSSYSAKFLNNKSYSVTTSNKYLKSRDSVVYSINVIPDLYPAIEVEEKKDSLSSKRIYFSGNIKDDYGFNKLTFNYKYLAHPDSGAAPQNGTVQIPINKNITQEGFLHYWDLSKLSLSPGDQLEYYFEVFDNDGVHGSKSSKTERFFYKAPTLKEISANTEKKNSEIKKDLEESIKDAKEIQRELKELNKKILEKKQLNWEEKKKVENILEKQNELEKKLEEIKNENLKKNLEQQEFKQVEENIVQKQEQLQQLMENIMSPEMKEMLKKLQEMMEKLDKQQMQEAVEKMQLNNKDIEKELDRSLELFKQLEFEEKLNETIEKLNELQKKEENLSEKSLDKKEDKKELKQKQDELNKEFNDLKKDLDDLEKKNKDLEQPNDLKSTEEQEKNIEKEMQESSEQLEKKNGKEASESQKDAAEKMEEMSKQLSQMQAEMQQKNSAEDINALREILENLVQLSFSQEDVMKQTKTTNINNPQYVKTAQKQKKLQDDSKMIEDSLLALSKRVPQIQSTVNREISAIHMQMGKAIEAMAERQSAEAASRQQFSMTSINNLALLLNEALKQMQDQMKNQQQGGGSCNKPGGKSKKPSMSDMRKMQEQLNEQMKKMQEGMQKGGKKPGKKPGEGQGEGGMSQELAKMAAQQEAIRRMMQEAADQLKKDGKEGLGPAGKLAKKMEETETDLVNKRITQETINRQQEILTRLLEHEKAEKEREQEEKRQAEQVKNENFSNPNQFLEYNRQEQKEVELLKTVPPALNQFYKNKVAQYFNKF